MNTTNIKPVSSTPLKFFRCAIYIRVSGEEQAREEHYSLSAQEENCMNQIRQHHHEGWIHSITLCDPGYSGFNYDRPAFLKLVSMVKKGGIDIVVAYKRDRLFRRAGQADQMEDLFAAHGVQVKTTEALFDRSPHSVFYRQFIDSNSQFERATIRLRIKDCLRYAARKGDWKAGIPPFGYIYETGSKTLTISESESVIVKLIFERIANGSQVYEILRELRLLNVYARPRRKPKLIDDNIVAKTTPSFFTSTYIRTIIFNPTYRGIVRVKKTDTDYVTDSKPKIEWEEFKGRHTPIISEDLWFRANRALSKPDAVRYRKPLGTSLGILSGLICCGCCNCAMTASSASRMKSSGAPHRYYRCSQLVKGGPQSACTTRQISCEAVESGLISLINLMEANPASFSRFGFENKSRKQEDMITEARAELFKIDAALQERRRKIDNFMKFISTEKDNILGNEVMVSAETAKNEIIGLENNRIQVESRLHKLAEKSPPISEVARAFGMLAKALSVATPSNKHELLTSVIRKIILRRIAVSSFKGSLFNKKRTFQLAIEFRTDGILNFGESDISLAVKRIGFSNIELKVTLEISSNRKEQKVLLMEAGYSTVSSVFGTPVASVPVPTLPNSENPIQRALRWQFLTENESKTASAVAIDEKVSKGLISQHIALLDLPQIIIDFMKSGRDHGMQKGFSLRELQRLLSMPTTEAIAQFHARIAGHPVQDIMPLS